jgi:hypothetical protein
LACTRYSIVRGGGGGAISRTWRRCSASTDASLKSPAQHPQTVGGHKIVSFGSSTNRKVVDPSPCCLPGGRPDFFRSERSLPRSVRLSRSKGESELGGFDELELSLPALRSNCDTRSASSSIRRSRSASSHA